MELYVKTKQNEEKKKTKKLNKYQVKCEWPTTNRGENMISTYNQIITKNRKIIFLKLDPKRNLHAFNLLDFVVYQPTAAAPATVAQVAIAPVSRKPRKNDWETEIDAIKVNQIEKRRMNEPSGAPHTLFNIYIYLYVNVDIDIYIYMLRMFVLTENTILYAITICQWWESRKSFISHIVLTTKKEKTST